jgi:prepilin peptidase CpaA
VIRIHQRRGYDFESAPVYRQRPMGWNSVLAAALPLVLMLLLVSAGIEDVRRREIANGKNLAIALLAPLWWWAAGVEPWPGMAIQLALGLVVFGAFIGLFALGAMGGGDVKMIGALALWLPWPVLLQFLVAMSLAGGAVTVAMAIEHRWRRTATPLEVPYGVAIAVAGLLALREPILNQFAHT